jgi:DNA-binding NarL/FixJ family response regulator
MVPNPEVMTNAGIASLAVCLPAERPDVAIVDVTLGIDLEEVGRVAAKWPDMPLLALGLREMSDEVVAHGRAGFVSYIARDASMSELHSSIMDAVAGRLQCPAEITGGLIRALFGRDPPQRLPLDKKLTKRETEILHMLSRNLSNKEIARELSLSVATIKSHVHNVLGKLGVAQRRQAMQCFRAMP